MMNVDLQDPPSEINKLLESMEGKDVDVVYGLRDRRRDNLIKRMSSHLFNWTLNKLTGDNTPLNVATLRIMSRRFVDAYNQLTEKSRYIPGLEYWLGFQKAYVPIAHQSRGDGKSSYTFMKRLKLAVNSILSFSDLPLRWAAILGMIFSLLGFL